MGGVTEISEASSDATMMSPHSALISAINDIGKNGALREGNKCLVLALDDTDGGYSVSFTQAGMTMSQCIALCEVAKRLFVAQMGF